ncbi:hypothetical protein ACVTMO_16840 [Pseudomonas segetis]
MNAQTQVALEDISEENAPAIYVTGGLSQFFDAVKAEVTGEVPDLATQKGRDRIASLAAKVSKSKKAVEKPGRDYLSRLKEMPKVVEAELREFVTAMDALRDETRRPLTEWEEAEKARKAQHQAGIEHLRSTNTEGASAETIASMIADLEEVFIGDDWQEFEAEAHRTKAASLEVLRAALAKQQKYETEQAELEDLRRQRAEQEQKDRDAKIAQEAADKARLDAEAEAKAEREASANRELELQLKAERAERERLEEQERTAMAALEAEARIENAERDAVLAVELERQRQAAEKKRQDDEAAAREADQAHKAKINRAAMEAFMAGGMTEECAKKAVVLIAKREIPNVQINY